MSVIATKIVNGSIEIAADSFIGNGDAQRKDTFAKLRKVNDLIIGTAGSAEEGGLMFQYAKTHQPKEPTYDGVLEFMGGFSEWAGKRTNDRVTACTNHFILVFQGKAFEVQNFYINEVEKFSAIGAGYIHAETALFLGATIEKAIEAACELSPWCELPVIKFTEKKA